MVAELGNFFIVVPYAFLTLAGVLFIWYVLRERKGPSIPNLTARRKHPLRHLQVELNRARRDAQAKNGADTADKGGEEPPKPKREPRPGDSSRRLRRLK